MLAFGALTLARRAVFHTRKKDVPRALLFLLFISVSLFFAVMAFYFAYAGINELLA